MFRSENTSYMMSDIYKLTEGVNSQRGTGILSDIDIQRNLDHRVIIHPFNKAQLGPNSYDVTLGEWYYQAKDLATDKKRELEFFCIDNPKHIANHWNLKTEPRNNEAEKDRRNFGAKRASQVKTAEDAELFGVSIGDKVIIVGPGETILAHTREFIGGKVNVTTEMKARSSTGRAAVTVCACAGSGDIGFTTIWTLEIKNQGFQPVVLKVGLRIAQILFHWCGDVERSYETRGQYQTTKDISELIRDWNPTQMLPSSAIKYIRELSDRETKEITSKQIDPEQITSKQIDPEQITSEQIDPEQITLKSEQIDPEQITLKSEQIDPEQITCETKESEQIDPEQRARVLSHNICSLL